MQQFDFILLALAQLGSHFNSRSIVFINLIQLRACLCVCVFLVAIEIEIEKNKNNKIFSSDQNDLSIGIL